VTTTRTNYCTNPRLVDSNDNGIPDDFSEEQGTQSVDSIIVGGGYFPGSNAHQMICSYVSAHYSDVTQWTQLGELSAGETITVSAYFKVTEVSGDVAIGLRMTYLDAASGYISETTECPLTTTCDWTRVSKTVTLPATTAYVDSGAVIVAMTTGEGATFQWSNLLVEKTDTLRPYFDGSWPLSRWTGAEDASKSEQTVSGSINDGNLSIKIDGVERRDAVHGMEWETADIGDGGGSFWMEPANPFYASNNWPELHHGSTIDVTHTNPIDGTTKQLYKGWVISDPRVAYAGENKRLTIEMGGVAEVARWRTDLGFVYTDSDPDQWFENKYNPKWATVSLGDRISISVDDETKITYGSDGPKAAVVGYMLYPGFGHMLNKLNGIRRIKGKVTYNLLDKNFKLRVRLAWREGYTASRDPSDYTTIKTWGTSGSNDKATDETLDETFATGGTKAGYLVLMMYTTDTAGHKVDGDRFFRMSVEVYTDTSEKSIDLGMLAIANYVGLHGGPSSTDTDTIGSVVESLAARPPTDPISALNTFASQADVLVHWGWFSYYSSGSYFQFRAKPMLTNPTTIRNSTNCYAIDATQPGTTWDVRQRQEDGEMPRTVRVIYGRKGSETWWPAGFPATAVAPKAPNFTSGQPFRGALAPVLTVDFSAHNYTDKYAKDVARKLARYVGAGLSTGTCTLKGIDVHRWSSGTTWRPAAYIKGGDWVECEQSNCGPLYVRRSHVDLDSETVTLDVGIGADDIIEQLEAAGGVFKHKLARRRTPKPSEQVGKVGVR